MNYCSICLNSIKKEEDTTKTNCKHLFHTECISRWLKIKTSCPLCRKFLINSYNINLYLDNKKYENIKLIINPTHIKFILSLKLIYCVSYKIIKRLYYTNNKLVIYYHYKNATQLELKHNENTFQIFENIRGKIKELL
jgi:hypothetical protein